MLRVLEGAFMVLLVVVALIHDALVGEWPGAEPGCGAQVSPCGLVWVCVVPMWRVLCGMGCAVTYVTLSQALHDVHCSRLMVWEGGSTVGDTWG